MWGLKMKNTFTLNETAKYLGVSISTIYRMEKKHLLSSIRSSAGQKCFQKDNIDKYLIKLKNFKTFQNHNSRKTKSSVKNIEDSFVISGESEEDRSGCLLPTAHIRRSRR